MVCILLLIILELSVKFEVEFGGYAQNQERSNLHQLIFGKEQG